jgi:hypothetical protein
MSGGRPPEPDRWEPWSPAEVAGRLRSCPFMWGAAGGWAIDLWLGRVTRPHSDMDVAASRSALPAIVECFPDLAFYVAEDGRLAPLDAEAAEGAKQLWGLDPAARKWRLDVIFDPGDEARWVYRRDGRIHAPRAAMLGRSGDGIPFLRPEAVLLFKAKAPRPKDEADLEACLPLLPGAARAWLADAAAAAHPDSPWTGRLRPFRTG